MKNKILGSALMIAGTTIGAGMLAMPLTSAGMGVWDERLSYSLVCGYYLPIQACSLWKYTKLLNNKM